MTKDELLALIAGKRIATDGGGTDRCYRNNDPDHAHAPVVGYLITLTAWGGHQAGVRWPVCQRCWDEDQGGVARYDAPPTERNPAWALATIADCQPGPPPATVPVDTSHLDADYAHFHAQAQVAPAVATHTAPPGQGGSMTLDIQEVVAKASVVVAEKIVKIEIPGKPEPQMLRVPGTEGLGPGEELHIRVRAEPRFSVTAVGTPGTLGEPTGFVVPQAQAHPTAAVVSAAGAPPASGLPHGLRMVQVPRNFYVPEQHVKLMGSLKLLRDAGKPIRVRVIGPTGTGKSTLVYYTAASWGAPFLKVNMATLQSPEQMLGRWVLDPDKGTYFQKSALIRALEHPNTVLFLEEVNRTHSSNINILMDIMDAIGELWIDEIGQTIMVHPTVAIFGAMNVGSQYTGTFEMDEAMISRFEYPVEMTYLPEIEEQKVLVRKTGVEPKIAVEMVALATATRQMAAEDSNDALDRAISTRTLLGACELIAVGKMSPLDAMLHTIIPLYSTEGGAGSQREKVLKIVQGKFGRSK